MTTSTTADPAPVLDVWPDRGDYDRPVRWRFLHPAQNRRERRRREIERIARQSFSQLGTGDPAAVVRQLGRTFATRQSDATHRAKRAARVAPILTVISAGGTAFAGAAVATDNLTGGWRTAIIIVTFLATGVGAGAAALRPTERAQAAKADAANAAALLTWLNILTLDQPTITKGEFRRRIQALQAWEMHQLGSQPYAYDGSTPWMTFAEASSAGAAAPAGQPADGGASTTTTGAAAPAGQPADGEASTTN